MYSAPDFVTVRPGFTHRLSKLGRLSKSVLMGAGVGVFGMVGSASAAETVLLRFDETQVTVSIQEIEEFAGSGTISGDLQEFFQKYPEIQEEAQTILDQQITVTEAFIERTLSGSTGEFVLIQLRKLLSNPSGDSNIESLRTTLIDAYEDDNRFSVLELLQKYPEEEIYVDLRGLQQVYGDVVTFVERIQPILETAREYLQDLVCDCPTPTASGGGGTASVSVKAADCTPTSSTAASSTAASVRGETAEASTVSTAPVEEAAIASPQPSNPAVPTQLTLPSESK